MKKLKLFKYCVIVGVLLGSSIKVVDFIRLKRFRCGFKKAEICSLTEYLTELPIWIIIVTAAILIIVFGGMYLIKHSKKSIKNILKERKKVKKANKKSEKINKTEKKKKTKSKKEKKLDEDGVFKKESDDEQGESKEKEEDIIRI